MPRRATLLASIVLLLASLDAPPGHAQDTGGRVLGPARGQVAWLDLSAPRPEPLTAIARPAFPADVSATPGVPFAVGSIISAFGASSRLGGDLVSIDLESGAVAPVLGRELDAESLDVPALWPDGGSVVYQRSLVSETAPTYQTRVERVGLDGQGRGVLIEDARSPTPAPDGSSVAFVRVSSAGAALWLHHLVDGREAVVVPTGNFVAIAYPRFSPDGQRLAFVAITQIVSPFRGAPGSALLGAPLAHGFPYEVWLIDLDGQGMRQIPEVMNDDPSIAWSPDGRQLLVYGGWGGQLIELESDASVSLPYLAGYGAIAWLP